MTKREFEERIHGHVSDRDYELIETVYTFHPVIKDSGGKDQIAQIYLAGGMPVMRDMYPTAVKAKDKDERIRALKAQIAEAEEEFARWYERRTV